MAQPVKILPYREVGLVSYFCLRHHVQTLWAHTELSLQTLSVCPISIHSLDVLKCLIQSSHTFVQFVPRMFEGPLHAQ
jgi:hypothetical protein